MKTALYETTYALIGVLLLAIIGVIASGDRSNASDKLYLSDSVDILPGNVIYVGSLAIVNEVQESGSTSLAEEKKSQKENVREITVSGSSLEACEKAMAEVIKSNKKVVELSQCEKQELELSVVSDFR